MSTQEQLDSLLTWENVYQWANEHKRAPFLKTDIRYMGYEALGISSNPLFCPLACYINLAIDDGPDEWRVRKGEAYRYEYDRKVHYPLPEWAKKAEELVDATGAFIGITQELFVAILEAVKPRSEAGGMSTQEQGPDATIWATSTDLKGDSNERKVYFVLIRDGDREINVAISHKPMFNEVHADMYVTPDYSYTIHDGCDHENNECVLDDPNFEEHWYGVQPETIYQEVRKGAQL